MVLAVVAGTVAWDIGFGSGRGCAIVDAGGGEVVPFPFDIGFGDAVAAGAAFGV